MQTAVLPLAVFAVIFTEPSLIAVTMPPATVAIDALLLVHSTLWLASSGSTVAVRAVCSPTFIAISSCDKVTDAAGVITVILQDALFPSTDSAVIVVVPLATAVTRPLVSTFATASSPEVQLMVLSVASSGNT